MPLPSATTLRFIMTVYYEDRAAVRFRSGCLVAAWPAREGFVTALPPVALPPAATERAGARVQADE